MMDAMKEAGYTENDTVYVNAHWNRHTDERIAIEDRCDQKGTR